MSVKAKMTAIADAIRAKTGSTELMSLDEIAENVAAVYDAGESEGYTTGYEAGYEQGKVDWATDWSSITDWRYFCFGDNRIALVEKLMYDDTRNGTCFSYMFSHSASLTTVPLLNTSCGTDFSYMFNYCTNLKSVPELDTRNGTNFERMFCGCKALTTAPLLNTSSGTDFFAMFQSCTSLNDVPAIDTSKGTSLAYMFCDTGNIKISGGALDLSSATDVSYLFQSSELTEAPVLDTINVKNFYGMFWSTPVKAIPKLNFTNATNVGNVLAQCKSLETVTIEGTISISGISVQQSTKLTVDSIMSFINALVDYSGSTSTYKITFGSTNLAKLTDEQKQIATDKGWTLA